jgi:hypothetical protein
VSVRIQMRRGTTSEWNSADPILNEGEIGYNSTLGSFKIGDGESDWSELDYYQAAADITPNEIGAIASTEKGAADGVAELDGSKNVITALSVVFEGATANDFETRLTVTEPASDITLSLPNDTDTLVGRATTDTLSNKSISGSSNTLSNIGNSALTNSAITINGTSVSLGGSITVAGDIESVTAGTGLSGGGDSGAVTLSVNTEVVATTSNTLTMSNKTLTSPVVTGLFLNDSSIVFEGSSADAHETTLTVVNPTEDRTITLPNNSGTVVTTGDTGTVTSTMIADGTIVDGDINASANIAVSKLAANTISGVTLGNNLNSLTIGTGLSGTSYNGSAPITIAIDSTVATTSGTQTLTNKTVSLANNTLTGTLAEFNTALNGADFASLAGAETLTNKTLGASTALGSDLSAATYKITNLGTPSASTDAATKQYVDDLAQGLHIHASCIAATTANIDLSSALENGDILDGVTLATGNRVLVKNQSSTPENGIYVVQASGAAVRAADFDTPAEIDGGDFVFVTGGTANDNTGWVQTETVVTVGTSPIIFTQFSGAGTYQAGTGLTLTGNVFSINTATTVDLSTAQTLSNKSVSLGSNTLSGTISQFNTALSDGDFATIAGSETFTNKTLTSPIVTGLFLNDSSIIFEGSSEDAFETTLTVTNPTEDRTITLPNATGTIALQGFLPASLTWGDLKNGKSA